MSCDCGKCSDCCTRIRQNESTVNRSLLKPPVQLLRHGEKLCVDRPGERKFVKGRAENRICETFEITANVQPVTGFELLQMPEGERERQHIDIWTRCPIKVRDVVQRDCYRYEVHWVEQWGPYNKARARLTDVDPL